jgi:hypothetical protein
MIHGFNTHDLCSEPLVVVLHVPEKFELRRGWPNDEDGIDTIERARDLVEEPRGVIGMLLGLSPPLRMPVDKVLRRQDRRFVDCLWLRVADRLRLNVEDASFLMIDPDHYVRSHDPVFDELCARSCVGRRDSPYRLPDGRHIVARISAPYHWGVSGGDRGAGQEKQGDQEGEMPWIWTSSNVTL